MVLNKRFSILPVLVLILQSFILKAQPLKYWVQFSDKNGSSYSISKPEAFLTSRSIARRTQYNIKVDQTDLPVVQAYLNRVSKVQHVKLLYSSKWLNGAVISINSASAVTQALDTINAFSFVSKSSKVRRIKLVPLPVPEAAPIDVLRAGSKPQTTSGYNYGGSNGQIRQLQVDCLHDNGFRGQGMVIAVCDAGFDNVDTSPIYDSLRKNGGILGTRDFVIGGENAYHGSSHGSMVLSCMAANYPGLVMGTAPLAKYWLLRTEDAATETISEEYNWVRGAEFADSVGVDIINTSLGYTDFDDPSQDHSYVTLDGKTAPMTIASTMAARKGMLVFNSAGNSGSSPWYYIGVPADADSICAVGAVDTLGRLAGFSSRGPTYDGRIKPDLVACGQNAWVCHPGNSCFPGNGTSFSSPILAGAAACYWQANKQLNNISILNQLRNTASNNKTPNNNIGWGIPRMCPMSGLALLKDQIAHAGIKVKFIPVSAGAKADSVTTNANGRYVININEGFYNVVFSKKGYYTLTYNTSPLFLSNSTTLQQVVLQPKNFIDFKVYTEPATGFLKVDLSQVAGNTIEVEVMDLLGRLLYSTKTGKDPLIVGFNAATVADGVYLARVRSEEGTRTIKFLKRTDL